MDVCASPIDGRRVVHAFLSAGPIVEVRLLRDTLGPLAAGPDATYGRYFMLGYNGNSHLRHIGLWYALLLYCRGDLLFALIALN